MLADNAYRSQVWLTSTDGSVAPHPITGGEHDGKPGVEPRRCVAGVHLVAQPEGRRDHGAHDADGSRRRGAHDRHDARRRRRSPRFSPDGTHLAFTSRTRHERYEAKDESWQAPRKIERFFGRLDNEGWVFDRPQHVYVVRTDGSAAPRNLTPGEFQHTGVAWTPDSASIVTSSQRHDTWDLDFASDLYRVTLDGTVTPLTKGTGQYGNASVSADGSTVAFIGADDSSTYPQNMHVGHRPDRRRVAPVRQHRRSTARSRPPPARRHPSGSRPPRCSPRSKTAARRTWCAVRTDDARHPSRSRRGRSP